MSEVIALEALASKDEPPEPPEPPTSTLVRRPSYSYQSEDHPYPPPLKTSNTPVFGESSGGDPAETPFNIPVIPETNVGDPVVLHSVFPTPAETPLSLSISRTSYPFPQDQAHSHHQYPPHTQEDVSVHPAGLATPGTDAEQPFFISALPPVDGGKAAWSFLIAATLNEALIWGLPFSVGVLHEYWSNTLFEGSGESSITLAAALLNGLLYMGAAFVAPFNTAFPRWTRVSQIFGLGCASIALISSAFVTQPWHLIVTLGCLYPMAGACYYPCATLLFEWFYAKRGLATGIMYGGTGAGGAIFPFIVSGLLKAFGYKATMITLGIGMGTLGGITLIFIKRRIPIVRLDLPESERRAVKIDWSFLKNRLMFASVAVTLAVSMGNFLPGLWLPTFAKELNLTKPDGTALLAIMNACAVPGNLILGYMTDRFPFYIVLLISTLGSALACLLLWGFGTTDIVLIFFVLIFGLFGLTFAATWAKMISLVAGEDMSLPPLIFSAFTFTRGIGSITSGPISDGLLKLNILNGSVGAYGFHNYGILLIYTGTTILAGGAIGMMFKT